MKARLAFTLPLLIPFLGCSDERMPRPTQRGAYTFGCKVDGKKWVADGRSGFMAPDPMEGGFIRSGLRRKLVIDIMAYKENGEIVSLYIDNVRVGVHPLNRNTQTSPVGLDPLSYGGFTDKYGTNYVTSEKYTGTVIINRADTIQGVISGVFEFTAATKGGRTVKIRAGRFDFDQNY